MAKRPATSSDIQLLKKGKKDTAARMPGRGVEMGSSQGGSGILSRVPITHTWPMPAGRVPHFFSNRSHILMGASYSIGEVACERNKHQTSSSGRESWPKLDWVLGDPSIYMISN